MALKHYTLAAFLLVIPVTGFAQVSSSTIPMWLDTSVSPAQWRRTGANYPLPVTATGGSANVYGKATAVSPSYTEGTYNPLSMDLSGELRTIVGAGTSIIGKVGIDQTTPGTTNGVQVNAALPAGSNTIGAVTQASGPWSVSQSGAPWSQNIIQFGGNAIVTGTGISGLGIPRVTVSSDSVVGINTSIPAGTNIVGKVGIDQTTPGTTNGVQVNAALPAGGNTIGAVTQASGPWTQNVTQFGGNAVATGTGASGLGIPRVTVSNDSTVGLNAGTNIVGKVGIDQTTPGTTNGVQVNAALPAGTNILGKTGIDQTTPGTTNGVTIAPTSAAAAGLASIASGAVESNHVLKASAGNLYNLTITVGATSGYLMIFNATSAPADGAVTPAYCFPIASNGTNGGVAFSWAPGPLLSFTTGITVVFSSTGCFTKTASATAAFFAQVQ